jgi:DNA polymerase-1
MTIAQVDTELRTRYRPHEVEASVDRLYDALEAGEMISGHNIINYDIPAINKIYPKFYVPRSKRYLVLDTLVLSRLIYTNLKDLDAPLLRSNKLPGKLFNSHSLRAWGHRLGVLKGDFALHTEEDEEKWAVFTDEMLDYNEQDVVVDTVLLKRLEAKGYSPMAIKLEHEVAWLMAQQQRNGFPFNIKKAKELEIVLRSKLAELEVKLLQTVPPIPDKDFIPKRDNKRLGYKAGVVVKRFKEFNANSRQQIEWIVTKYYGYHPDELEIYNISKDARKDHTEDQLLEQVLNGKYALKIDDETFTYIKNDDNCPEGLRDLAGLFEEYLLLSKRLGQLADGKQAWLKCVKEDGMIHGSVNPNGAVTGRATHSHPNVAQVPASKSPYGHECRELFEVPEGWYQVGVDASGLELRCLAHFMYPYDNGVYADAVVNGDVHTLNQIAAGLPTRDNAKTFIYGFLYGAGDAKIGKIVKGTKATGTKLKKSFLAKTPAIMNLKQAIENQLVAEMYRGRVRKWKRKYLKGLDGRHLHIRSLHSALNTLLQSAGALICKKWIVLTEEMMIEKGYVHGWDGDFCLMAWIHDEQQVACRSLEIAEDLVKIAQAAMRKTQEFFNFRVQLDTDAKIGKNWAECH